MRLEEIAVEKRGPVLKAYLQRAPGARPHVAVDKDAPLEKFEAIAAQIPMFLRSCRWLTIGYERRGHSQ